MSNTDSINRFFDIISDNQSKSEALAEPFFTRILLLALLDALGRCAHPATKSNKERFVSLIDEYAQWSHASRYSLIQLAFRIADVTNPSAYPGLHRLNAEVNSRLEKWPTEPRLVYPEEVDPTRDELHPLLTNELANLIEPVRFPSLLWALRNFAIHELRSPGAGFDFRLGKSSPYYHGLEHADGITHTWELYFPNQLLSQLLTTSSANLKQRLLRDDADPWHAFPYSPKWY